ncbi:MAG: hypothetical protein QW555_08015 [Nitrososphaerota archaeon]
MAYTGVRDIRVYNAWLPIQVSGDSLTRRTDTVFQTSYFPVVDFDFDGQILDDITVYVNGSQVDVASLDAERGLITLINAPPNGATVTTDYYWHPISDSEIGLAISGAEAEIELLTGFKYSSETVTERHILFFGNEFRTRKPIINVNEVKIYSILGTLIDTQPQYIVVDNVLGLVRILNYRAGIPTRPYFLPAAYEVEITYQAGYSSVPDYIKNAVILFATYQILLKFQRLITFEKDYTQISLTFKSPEEFARRLEFIRQEIERVKKQLPKRVGTID